MYLRYISIYGIEEESASYKTLMEELCDMKLVNQQRGQYPSLRDLTKLFTPPLTQLQQFQFLSYTPNSHYESYILAKRQLAAKRFASVRLHLLYNPNNTDTSNSHAPTSFQQRILYFLHIAFAKRIDYVFRSITQKILSTTMPQRKPLETPIDQRRRAKQQADRTISPGLPVSPEAAENAYKRVTGYQQFKEQMLTVGILLVRNMSDLGGRLIMNSCETKSGNIQHDKFVNLVYVLAPDKKLELECNCPDFKHTAGEGGMELDPDNQWMSEATRCMHVRLLFELFEESIKQLPNISVNETEQHLCHLQKQLKVSCYTTANCEVAVVSHANYLILHVELRPGELGVFVKIHPTTHDTTSTCKCTHNNVRSQSEYWREKHLDSFLCIHIRTALKEINIINKFVKTQRRPRSSFDKCEKFSKQEGKWVSASLLKHKPKQKGDEIYQRFVYEYMYIYTLLLLSYMCVLLCNFLL